MKSVVLLEQVFDALQAGNHRGVVHAQLPEEQARLVISDGQIVEAFFGELLGDEALSEVLRRTSEIREVHWYPEGHENNGRGAAEARRAAERLVEQRGERSERWRRLRQLCPPLGSVLLPELPALSRPPADLPERGRAVLALVDGWRSILEILGDSDLDPADALDGVRQLLSYGLVSVAEG